MIQVSLVSSHRMLSCVQSILFILGSCGACVVSRVEAHGVMDGNFAVSPFETMYFI